MAYGGLIANLIDCHSIGTAIAATYEAEGREPGTEPGIMYVTANLNIDCLKPPPITIKLLLRAKVTKLTVKKAIVTCPIFTRYIEMCPESSSGHACFVAIKSGRGIMFKVYETFCLHT